MNAIDILKTQIKEKGDVDDKEFKKIMLNSGSKQGLDPIKGEKTKSKNKVIS